MGFSIKEAREIYNSRFSEYALVFEGLYSELEKYLKEEIEKVGCFKIVVGYSEYCDLVDAYHNSLGRKSILPLKDEEFEREFICRASERLIDCGFYTDINDNDSELFGWLQLEVSGWVDDGIKAFFEETDEDDVGILDDYTGESCEYNSGIDSKSGDDLGNCEMHIPESEEDIIDELLESSERAFDRGNNLDWFEEKPSSIDIEEDEESDYPKYDDDDDMTDKNELDFK